MSPGVELRQPTRNPRWRVPAPAGAFTYYLSVDLDDHAVGDRERRDQ
jgi:hypothetical protein